MLPQRLLKVYSTRCDRYLTAYLKPDVLITVFDSLENAGMSVKNKIRLVDAYLKVPWKRVICEMSLIVGDTGVQT